MTPHKEHCQQFQTIVAGLLSSTTPYYNGGADPEDQSFYLVCDYRLARGTIVLCYSASRQLVKIHIDLPTVPDCEREALMQLLLDRSLDLPKFLELTRAPDYPLQQCSEAQGLQRLLEIQREGGAAIPPIH